MTGSPLSDDAPFEVDGFVNAHMHLELSHLAGEVPGGAGLPAWVRHLFRQPERTSASIEAALSRTVQEVQALGTVAVVDVANTGRSTRALVEADLQGLVQREVIGWDPQRWSLRLAGVGEDGGPPGEDGLVVVPTAHSTYSCSPELLATVLSPGVAPKTVHIAEDQSEHEFLQQGTGPWAALLDWLDRPWRARHIKARSPVALLDELGVLGPHLGLVHCVWVDGADLDLIASSGATVVLCPRSNLHIGGRLPDVPAMLDRGIPLAIGTDSLASAPDLDLLAEAATLRQAFPAVDPQVWLQALTSGGARLLGRPAPTSRLRFALPAGRDPLEALFDGTSWPRSLQP